MLENKKSDEKNSELKDLENIPVEQVKKYLDSIREEVKMIENLITVE